MSRAVGIRELRQNLSKYLRRVERGERLTVTDRNKPVAVLAPLPDHEDWLQPLIDEGLVLPGRGLDLSELKPVDLGDPTAGSRALEEVRGDR